MSSRSKAKSSSTSSSKKAKRKPANINQVKARVRELAKQDGYDELILLEFAEFVHGGKFKPMEPSINELKEEIFQAFGCKDLKELRNNKTFKLATAGRKLNFSKKEDILTLYREWVKVPESERNDIGSTSINGIDVLKNFRPWQVFQLDPKTATTDDINAAFRELSKKHHPDVGGNREVFEKLQKMRDSLLMHR